MYCTIHLPLIDVLFSKCMIFEYNMYTHTYVTHRQAYEHLWQVCYTHASTLHSLPLPGPSPGPSRPTPTPPPSEATPSRPSQLVTIVTAVVTSTVLLVVVPVVVVVVAVMVTVLCTRQGRRVSTRTLVPTEVWDFKWHIIQLNSLWMWTPLIFTISPTLFKISTPTLHQLWVTQAMVITSHCRSALPTNPLRTHPLGAYTLTLISESVALQEKQLIKPF